VQEIHSEKLIELKNDEISTEKKKSDNLLNNILPEEISTNSKPRVRLSLVITAAQR